MSLSMVGAGHLRKLRVKMGPVAQYWLPLDDQEIYVNDLIGQTIRLRYDGTIHCQHCGRSTNKSFSQGYCFPCFKALPQCDSCILSPEKCHFHLDTCRDPGWGEQQCMQDHIVYLANSSGVKVGITRASQVPTRWLDQGAVQALPILRVSSRFQSGLLESAFKQYVSDRTQWQTMLKSQAEPLDLLQERDRLFEQSSEALNRLELRFGSVAVQRLYDEQPITLNYPVERYPHKVSSLSFDKTPVIEGTLEGIKGQYLILDTGVVNIRKFTAYRIEFFA